MHVVENDTVTIVKALKTLPTWDDVEIVEMETLNLCPSSLCTLEGFFQKEVCVPTSSRTSKEP
jgi:hypothetical protein